MKRYEKMSKEEMLAVIESMAICSACKISKKCCIKNHVEGGKFAGCTISLHDWLTEEIKMKKVHRYELIKSPEDVKKLKSEFEDHCVDCLYCKYEAESSKSGGCFCAFLIEEIEVEVEE